MMQVFLGFVAYFLWTEHRAHVVAFLPYTILLLCPLMHLFHHKGQNHHGADVKGDKSSKS